MMARCTEVSVRTILLVADSYEGDVVEEILDVPDDVDLAAEVEAWRKWYWGEYVPALPPEGTPRGGTPRYIEFKDFLVERSRVTRNTAVERFRVPDVGKTR